MNDDAYLITMMNYDNVYLKKMIIFTDNNDKL